MSKLVLFLKGLLIITWVFTIILIIQCKFESVWIGYGTIVLGTSLLYKIYIKNEDEGDKEYGRKKI